MRTKASNLSALLLGSLLAQAACLEAPAAPSPYDATVQADSPVGLWRLDEAGPTAPPPPVATNLGSLGPPADGAYLNGVLMAQPGAIVGDADTSASFNAASSHKIDVPYQAGLNPTAFTIECWAKVTGGSGHRSPLASRRGTPSAGYILYCTPENTWEFWIGNTNGGWNSVAGGAVTMNAWTHLVGVYNGTTMSFYVNGQFKGSLTTNLVVNPSFPLRIGASGTEGAGQFFFQGGVDEVAVYSTPLSGTQIQGHYDAGTNGLGTYAATILADSPVGYWHLNEPTPPPFTPVAARNTGSLGASADGTYLNGVLTEQPGALVGDANTAARFDGSNDKIDVPWNSSLNHTQFSVECWAKVTGGAGSYRCPVASRADQPQRGYIIYAASNNKWEFWSGTGAQVGWTIISGPDVVLDQWVHLVGTYDGAAFGFYLNGSLVGSRTALYGINPTNVFRIGAGATEGAGSFFFNGVIDEVAAYDRALSPERVLAHYAAGMGLECIAPTITGQPVGTNLFEGGTLVLNVRATGYPLNYRWFFFGGELTDQTNSTLVISNASVNESGTYSVDVFNNCGLLTSDPVEVNVLPTSPPVITADPVSQTVYRGGRAVFEVSATGGLRFEYQWRLGGENLPGETNRILVVTSAQSSNAGDYDVMVSNAAGSTPSGLASLTVLEPEAASYAAAVVADHPVALWRLSEAAGPVVHDLYGGYHGFVSNIVTLGLAGALVGDLDTAAGFDGISAKVEVPYASALNPASYTIECWARVDGGAGTFRSPLSSRDDPPVRGFIFYASAGDRWEFWTGTNGAPGTWNVVAGPPVGVGEWVHLAGSYGAGLKKFYVNGSLVGQAADLPAGANDRNPLRIGAGRNETPGEYWFNGAVDEVAIYDHVLSPARIREHWAQGIGSVTLTIEKAGTDLVIRWTEGTLEAADQVTGGWDAVPDAVPPSYSVPEIRAHKFYRVRLP